MHPLPLFMGDLLNEERQLMKCVGIFQVGIFCVGIFRVDFPGSNLIDGNFSNENFPGAAFS